VSYGGISNLLTYFTRKQAFCQEKILAPAYVMAFASLCVRNSANWI